MYPCNRKNETSRKLLTKRAADVGHLFKVGHAPTIDPLKQLSGSKSSRAELLFKKVDQLGIAVIEKILAGFDRHNNPLKIFG